MKKHAILLFLSICLSFKLAAQKTDSSQCFIDLAEQCRYWEADSLAQNGFRNLLASVLVEHCNLKGKRWVEVRSYLGRPGEVVWIRGTNYKYTYLVQSFGRSFVELGNRFLCFWVEDDVITKIWIYEIDG